METAIQQLVWAHAHAPEGARAVAMEYVVANCRAIRVGCVRAEHGVRGAVCCLRGERWERALAMACCGWRAMRRLAMPLCAEGRRTGAFCRRYRATWWCCCSPLPGRLPDHELLNLFTVWFSTLTLAMP